MKGNLTIDNGNTSVKVAFYIGTQVVATNRFTRRDVRLLDRFISTYKPVSAIVCRDRIATAVGAWSIAQRLDNACDVLVIDAGTAITYDLITADGCFVGGNIAPGLGLRFKSLHEHTGLLPLVDVEGDAPVVGYDTLTAIRSGVLLGLLGEIKSYISDLKLSHPNLMVFMTGGDGKLLHQRLGIEEIIHYEHLAAEGLNRIYLFNNGNENR